MSTNRELFFKYRKQGIPDRVIYFSLEECNDFDHLLLTQNFDQEIRDEKRFVSAMDRYQNGEMIEYVFNKAYFLNKQFYINKTVLIPRQETEQLVLSSIRMIKEMFSDVKITTVDLCTGSGIIGISIANEFKYNRIILADISPEALAVAKVNIDKNSLNSNISILEGDLLEPLLKENIKADVIICNPPYIENPMTIDERTWKQEPHLALLAKPATCFYERVLKDLAKITNDRFLVCFEIGEDMEMALTDLVNKYCPESLYFFEDDIYGKRRFLFIKKTNF